MGHSFKHSLMVRFRDVDMLGHVNNAVYFTYLEEARMAYLTSLGYRAKNFQKECPIILASASCDYKSAAFLNERLDIYTGVTEIKNASFVLSYEIKDQQTQRLVAEAKTVLVTYDYAAKKVIPIPPALRAKIRPSP